MKGYIEYVYDIPATMNRRFLKTGIQPKKVSDYVQKFDSKNELEWAIRNESNQQVLEYISGHLDLKKYYKSIIFSTNDKSYADNVDFSNPRAIINFKTINEIKYINEHFQSVNKLLPDAGIYIGRVETYGERKRRLFRKYGSRIGQPLWLLDFIVNRVFAKIRPVDKIYRLVSRIKIHPLSKAEVLGRLVFCGFDIVHYITIDNLFYFVVIKTSEPDNNVEPTYHAFIRLKRIGKGGKFINVYKLRTMHPYSEFLQNYVIRLYEYNTGGKPADNFRISRWGKFLRKYWIDEIPQLINVLKGEMKIVGIRPVGPVRFKEFPKDIQEERIKYKPGCIPPYIALLMPDNHGNIEAERIYYKEYAAHPFLTDLKYFFISLFNILSNKIRGL